MKNSKFLIFEVKPSRGANACLVQAIKSRIKSLRKFISNPKVRGKCEPSRVDDKKFFRARHAGSSLWSYWVFYDEVNAKQTQMGWE